MFVFALAAFAQGPVDNPYRPVKGLADGAGPTVPGGEWARLPGGREMGPPASVHVEAGGRVTNVRGGPWRLEGPGILASNGLIHDAILSGLSEARPLHR